MTYLVTTAVNEEPPIAKQDSTTGRLIREDNSLVNLGNWLSDVVTAASGVSLNLGSVEQDTGQVLHTMQNGETQFQSDFQKGLDTLSKFHLIYGGAATLPPTVNGSATGGDGEVSQANFTEGFIPTLVDYAGVADTNQWIIQSQTTMKFYSAGNGFVVCNARPMATAGYLGNLFGVLVSREGGVDTPVNQISWNINDFLTDTVTATNPAGLEYHAGRINTFVFQIPLQASGDVKFGFVIGNKLVFAHEFIKQNLLQSSIALVNKPLRIEGSKISGSGGVVRFGFFDHNSGYFFEHASEDLLGPSLQSQFYSLDAHSYGAISNEFYRTFSEGNRDVARPVLGVAVPLVSIVPKAAFPVGTVANEFITSLKEINIGGSSVNLNDAVFVQVLLSKGTNILVGAFFSSVDIDSSVDFDVVATGVLAGGKQIYSATIYPNKGNVIIDIEKALSNFMNKYTCSRFQILGFGPNVDLVPAITVTAVSLSGNKVDMSAQITWAEKT